RLMPLVQQIYAGWAGALGNRQALTDVLALLDQKSPAATVPATPRPFRETITLDNVSFAYDTGREPALDGVSLTIARGTHVGLAGRTGSGKSTLVDIVLGLLEPTSGRVLVDGVPLDATTRRAWQANVAHVPQFIYLS